LLIHLLLCMFCSSSECKGEDKVIQEQGDVIAAEGDTVTLGCRFETTRTGPTLFWYKQEFLLYITEGGSVHEAVSGFSAHIDKTEKRADLEISSAAVTDSAVYYCALQGQCCLHSCSPCSP
uniref:Ig-like domain-containing protein n=1 Tax=Oreochromis aureus TaxID=47969 RepID=A0A668S4M8_OREAU